MANETVLVKSIEKVAYPVNKLCFRASIESKATFKKPCKRVSVSDVRVSKDGETTIVSSTDYTPDGNDDRTAVYDRQ